MAEILLSLTIIGVVAAITLPSLTGNINERTWNTQRKALYARVSQAISLMPALNGFGTLDSSTDNAAETFITSGLSKVLKINNICDNAHLTDCGVTSTLIPMGANTKISIPTTLYSLNGAFSSAAWSESAFSTMDTKAVAFETQNGENIVAYYNRSCRTEYLNQEGLTHLGNAMGFPQANMCLNLIYDLNGKKGPNTVGKDIGIITVFNATDSITVAPMPSSIRNAGNNANYQWDNAAKACTNENPESRIPNINELSAMILNKNIINLNADLSLWSSSIFNSTKAWGADANYTFRHSFDKTNSRPVRCILR